MTIFRPMLAAKAELDSLTYPKLASPKLDGVRLLVRDGVAYSRNNKPLRNRFVQKKFGKYNYYDGEAIVGSPTAEDCYRTTVSGVMSEDGEPDVMFYAFDHYQYPSDPFLKRYALLKGDTKAGVFILPQTPIENQQALEDYEQVMLEHGFEGVMLRDPYAPYKQGRSSLREGFLLKVKRFLDGEYKVLGFQERCHNANVATVNELGFTHRSSHKENIIGRGDLGALILEWPAGGTFNCGSGFTDEERKEVWQHKDKYIGKLAKVKYLPIGMKDLPRHPIFLGWRDPSDL